MNIGILKRTPLIFALLLSGIGLVAVLLMSLGNYDLALMIVATILSLFVITNLKTKPEVILYLLIASLPFINFGVVTGFSKAWLLIMGLTIMLAKKRVIAGLKTHLWRKDPIVISVTLIIVGTVLSIIRAYSLGTIDDKMVWQILSIIGEIGICTLIIGLIDRKNKFDELVTAIQVPVVIISTIIVLHAIQYQGDVLGKEREIRILTADINANVVAMFTGPVVMLMMGRALNMENQYRKMKSIIAISISIIALAITNSRGSWVGVLVGGLYIMFRSGRMKIILLFILLAPVLAFFLGESIATRVGNTNLKDLSIISRFVIWAIALQCIAISPCIGFGPDGFRSIKFMYGFPRFIDMRQESHTHNIYLELLVNFGAICFVGFLILIVHTLRRMDRLLGKGSDKCEQGTIIGLNAAVISFLAHGIFDCGIPNLAIMVEMVVIVSLCVLAIRDHRLVVSNVNHPLTAHTVAG